MVRCIIILYKSRSGLPSVPVQRSLTLIAKVIQSLANLNTVSQVTKKKIVRARLIHMDRASRKKPSCMVFKTF